MCGGIRFINFLPKIGDSSPPPVSTQQSNNLLEVFYWSPNPSLPVVENNELKLIVWGNRDRRLQLPKTGWARIETVLAGGWNHLNIREVIIPAVAGYEKGVWFNIEGEGIMGLLAKHKDTTRVYMVTEPATPVFERHTGHTRMPKVIRGRITF